MLNFLFFFYSSGCPLQWISYKENCYYFSAPSERSNFDETKEMCNNKTSSMLIINDEDEQVILFRHFCVYLSIHSSFSFTHTQTETQTHKLIQSQSLPLHRQWLRRKKMGKLTKLPGLLAKNRSFSFRYIINDMESR